MFSEYCAAPFEVEAAEVVTPSGETIHYPSLAYRTETIQKNKVNKLVGEKQSFIVTTNHESDLNLKHSSFLFWYRWIEVLLFYKTTMVCMTMTGGYKKHWQN